MEQFNETPLQGILGTDNGKLFYLLQIEKVSDLVKLRGFKYCYRPYFKMRKFRGGYKCYQCFE